MMCQKFDNNGYGTAFPKIPSFNSSTTDAKLVWTDSALLATIKTTIAAHKLIFYENGYNGMDGFYHF